MAGTYPAQSSAGVGLWYSEGGCPAVRYLRVLKEAPYEGPLVFEIPPHKNAMENLRESFSYVQGLLGADRAAL